MVADQMNGNSNHTGSLFLPLKDLPKSNVFTSNLPTDSAFPTPAESHRAPREKLGPRQVRSALFTFVRPQHEEDPELLGVSPRAMEDIGILESDKDTEDFRQTLAGNTIFSWNEETGEGVYPWAQCYGGWQFGSWAAQLGDGRAISLFETTNPETKKRYELQLKGAGKTPYSRFADGRAVLRSSIREYIVSEALNALRIPTTRALALTRLPHVRVQRETSEPGAIVARFAESWLRIGTFDLLRSRGERKMTRQLATYVAEHVFSGWTSLPARVPLDTISDSSPEAVDIGRDIPADQNQGEGDQQENRFARVYREIVRRNAKTVAAWQAYAFTNGVLNTDNTSIYGLSIDFGPFAFLDNFDPSYTPNHDDHMLRYSYRNQPTIIWWNLVRLGEDLGELIGAGQRCDDQEFIEKGVSEDFAPELIKRAQSIIERAGEEYKAVFLSEYKDLMKDRLGFKSFKQADFEDVLSALLDNLESLELDFNHTFRKLSSITLENLSTKEGRSAAARKFFHAEGISATAESEDDGVNKMAEWLDKWRARIEEDWGTGAKADAEREAQMKSINPKFLPRSWILDEVIERVQKQNDRDILGRVMNMALHPFNDEWSVDDRAEEERFCGDVPKYSRAMQCSCSS